MRNLQKCAMDGTLSTYYGGEECQDGHSAVEGTARSTKYSRLEFRRKSPEDRYERTRISRKPDLAARRSSSGRDRRPRGGRSESSKHSSSWRRWASIGWTTAGRRTTERLREA